MSHCGVVVSIDPGQKSGPNHRHSVIQVWLPANGMHLLRDQWREQAPYWELRAAVRHFIARHRPSAVLIEDTNQGPALLSEIKPQSGMTIQAVLPVEDKSQRLRRHLPLIRGGGIQLPHKAAWRPNFIDELTLFPYAHYDDQIDAMVQNLYWISKP